MNTRQWTISCAVALYSCVPATVVHAQLAGGDFDATLSGWSVDPAVTAWESDGGNYYALFEEPG